MKFSQEHKDKISAALKGKKKSKDHNLHNSQAHIGLQAGENNPFFGKHHSEETRKKLSEKSKLYMWINNSIEEKHILKTELEKYLSLGYTCGRLKFSEEVCKKMSETKATIEWKDKAHKIYSSEEVKNARDTTLRKNGTYNSSAKEDFYYEKLISIFKKEDILRQYCCLEYPYKVDFYICSLNLFIELNLHWTHGIKPFNDTDQECILILKEWENKAKNSRFYKNAIAVWTEKDVEKRKTAEKNNLNFIALYNDKEVNEFINKIKGEILDEKN